MNSTPVIRSLLDTDLYKLTMWQTFLHHYPSNQAEYRFVCRNTPQYPLARIRGAVEDQLDHLCSLRFSEDDLTWLSQRSYFKSDFIDFLRIFPLQRRYLHTSIEGDDLAIIAKGPQIHVSPFEIYVLSIVNEIYFRGFEREPALAEARRRLDAKITLMEDFESDLMTLVRPKAHPFEFFEFGTRRRFSAAWQEEVVTTLAARLPTLFKGTSNMYLASSYGLTAFGTMAHEYLQTFQAVGVQLKASQQKALETWVQEYRGDLGIALTDVIGMDAFLADLDPYFAKLFDGMRHDSGDADVWAEKALGHYKKLKIDAHGKRLVFSNGLNFPQALKLYERYADRVQVGFGIGTDLSNDTGLEPLNIVMKIVSCNGQPVAKLSDDPGKTLCEDVTFLNYLKQVFHVAPERG